MESEIVGKEMLIADAEKAQTDLQSYIQFVGMLQQKEEQLLVNVSFLLSNLIEVVKNG